MLSREDSERGFTLVEMIVALVVFGVLIAAVFPLVSELTRSGARDGTRTAAMGDARTHAQTFESDLRAMRAPLRPTGDGVDVVNVISALNDGRPPLPLPAASWPDIPTSQLWGYPTTHDLLFAGPNTIVFWADVVDNPVGAFRAELVRWYLLWGPQAVQGCPSDRTWCLVREVRYATNANGSASQAYREVLSAGLGALPPSRSCFPNAPIGSQTQPRVFCYQSQVPNSYAWNTWSRTSCQSRWTGITPDPNALTGTNQVRLSTVNGNAARPGVAIQNQPIWVAHERQGPLSNPGIQPLDRITTIGAMIPGGGAANGATDVQLANAQVTIPSRSSSEYRTAILCGAR